MDALPAGEFPTFAETIRMVLRLDPEVFALAQSSAGGLWVSLLVVLLAAISEAVGQSIVLFINRVRPWRFVLAQAIAILSNIIGYALWASAIWLAVWFVFGVREPVVATFVVVGLAYAPQLFAFFEMMPWLGNAFGLLLSLWSMAAVVVAIQFGMGLALWQAALTGLISWAAIQLFRRSLGRPIYALGRFIQQGAAGSQMSFSLADVYEGNLNREQYSPTFHFMPASDSPRDDTPETVGAPAQDTPPQGIPQQGVPAQDRPAQDRPAQDRPAKKDNHALRR